MAKRKNISLKVRNGTILHTRDEYIYGSANYRKRGYENKGNYRKVVVVDSNSRDQLAVVKLYSNSGKALPGTKSRYKPFVEVRDDDGKRIKVGSKFIRGGQKLSKYHISLIKNDCFRTSSEKKKNRRKVRSLKGRN